MNISAIHSQRIQNTITTVACLLALLFLHTPEAAGQGWLRYYFPPDSLNGITEEPNQMVVAPNGDLIFAGTTHKTILGDQTYLYMQRCKPNGDPVWFKLVQIPDVWEFDWDLYFFEPCPGGGYVAGGGARIQGTYQAIILKVTDAGNLVWRKMPSNPATYGYIKDVVPTPDGNILAGGSYRDNNNETRPVAYKINAANGSVMWSGIGSIGNNASESVSSIALAPNGNIILAGRDNNNSYIHIIDGTSGWEIKRIITDLDLGNDAIVSDADASEFSYIAPGSSNATVYYRRYNYSGNFTEEKSTSLDGWISLTNGTRTPEGYVFLQNHLVFFPGTKTPVLYSMDSQGNFSPPVNTMGGLLAGSLHLAHNVKSAQDGGFFIVGSTTGTGQLPWFVLRTDSLGQIPYSLISGNTFQDNDLNCSKTTGESGLLPVQVRATDLDFGIEWHAVSDTLGDFLLSVPVGEYEVEAVPPGNATGVWEPCSPQTASVLTVGDTVTIPPIGLKPLVDCPILQLDIAAGLFRPCSTTVVAVTVTNVGTAPADSAVVMLSVDPMLTYQSSTAPLLAQNGNQFWFDAGAVDVLGTAQFSVNFEVNCDAQMNEVLCIGGHVTPDTVCETGSTWDGSELKVDVVCDGDSIRFQVSNIGAGNMGEIAELIIIEDYIILLTAPLQLEAGQDTVISLPNPDGQLYYARIPQADGFPGDPYASDGKDFCDGGAPSGMLLQYPLYAGGRADARYCEAVRTSYDPNDKRGFPLGYGPEHFIEPGVSLRYMIRFQNTGNDTAFNITVRDTLPLTLDPATLSIGSASHPFEWSLSGQGVLVFKFPNILLPDSSTNEALSHGFVQFSIDQKEGLPLGTVIENRAAIYFDFNAPVFTEFAWHTLGNSIFTDVETPHAPSAGASLHISPNPFVEQTEIAWEPNLRGDLSLKIFDSQGTVTVAKTTTGSSGKLEIPGGILPSGLYWAELRDAQGRLLGAGKLLKLQP